MTLAWGAKVSGSFRSKVRDVATRLECAPDDLMACIAWESGRSFRPDVKNMAGSGATGLIQFMPTTAADLGTSVSALEHMTAEEQLDWVEKYFHPFRGKLHGIADLYLAILYPKAVGKPLDYVLWDKETRPVTYRQNAGLDLNKDGKLTKGEAASRVAAMVSEGLCRGNAA